jgi:hypothetical protein
MRKRMISVDRGGSAPANSISSRSVKWLSRLQVSGRTVQRWIRGRRFERSCSALDL